MSMNLDMKLDGKDVYLYQTPSHITRQVLGDNYQTLTGLVALEAFDHYIVWACKLQPDGWEHLQWLFHIFARCEDINTLELSAS
jgi:hypothetical protein